jgi:perosamine synthetase
MKQQIKSDFNFIPVFEPFISLSDNLSVIKSLLKKNISGSSSPVKKFEDQFSKFHSRNYGIGVTNGSVALDLAFASLDLEEGDEVILPSHTIISCLASIVRNNGTPVFCDVNSETWNMTLDNVKKVTTKNTKAVLMVHTFGLPADAINISNFCNENNIYLIEDAAEAHGQTLENKRRHFNI